MTVPQARAIVRDVELLLMRHAKSAWNTGAATDHERPLNGRGRRTATAMARTLYEEELIPDRILTSDAARALETCRRLSSQWATDVVTDVIPALYLGGLVQVVRALQALRGPSHRVLIIGHNPGLELCARAWGATDPMKTGDVFFFKLDDEDPGAALREGRIEFRRRFRGRAALDRFPETRDLPLPRAG
ncbi:MAG: histidine phosphatase family protein [Myxococcota bacterium]